MLAAATAFDATLRTAFGRVQVIDEGDELSGDDSDDLSDDGYDSVSDDDVDYDDIDYAAIDEMALRLDGSQAVESMPTLSANGVIKMPSPFENQEDEAKMSLMEQVMASNGRQFEAPQLKAGQYPHSHGGPAAERTARRNRQQERERQEEISACLKISDFFPAATGPKGIYYSDCFFLPLIFFACH